MESERGGGCETCAIGEEVDVEGHEVEEEEAGEVEHGHHGLHADEGKHFAEPHEREQQKGEELVGKELEQKKQNADHDLKQKRSGGDERVKGCVIQCVDEVFGMNECTYM